jgi:hypothetical protein
MKTQQQPDERELVITPLQKLLTGREGSYTTAAYQRAEKRIETNPACRQ